jgi:hypothetical protein
VGEREGELGAEFSSIEPLMQLINYTEESAAAKTYEPELGHEGRYFRSTVISSSHITQGAMLT